MKALVTGATGFIGGNLVRELIARGYRVRALVRDGSNRGNIAGLDVETACGDLTDRDSLARALDGCDYLFHTAAAYTFWSRRPQDIYAANVDGTRNIFAAAGAAGIRKIVYTSSESTLKIANGCPGDESGLAAPGDLPGDYKKSKCLAEMLALDMCREGLPVVVVNPTTPIGEYDIKPTPTGQIIVSYLNRRMPACTDTGLNVVDVRDVARGHVLALEKGRIGERYVLGNANVTLGKLFALLERITGIPAPRVKIPLWLALGAAYASELVAGRLLGRYPPVPVAAVKAARKYRHFDCSRAVRELGMPQTPVIEAFTRAVAWFRQKGYVKR